MKHTLFILALITATIQTFAQSPRIKLNQITKDSVTGSVLISSPTDSGMVYSRDLFISYGADTVLILGGDTLAATSSIISSVLSDGVTITGNGTTGSELTADTSVLATLRALSDSLALVISSVTADNVTITGDGTVGSPLKVDTATVVASVGRLLDSLNNVRTDLDLKQDQLNGTGFVKASGTTISYDNSTYLTSEVDGSVTNEIQDISTTGAAGNISISSGSTLNLNVDDADASASNELQTLSYNSSTNEITLSDAGGTEDLSNLDLVDSTRINATGDTAYYYQNGVLIGAGAIAGGGGGTTYNNISENLDTVFISDHLDVDTATLFVDAINNRVGIGTSTPDDLLEVGDLALVVDSTSGGRIKSGTTQSTYLYATGGNLPLGRLVMSDPSTDTDGTNYFFGGYRDGTAGKASINFMGARTNDLPLRPNDQIGNFVWRGKVSQNDGYINSALIAATVTDTTNITTETKISIYTSDINGSLNENLTILGNGNVGIGTTSPSVELDVIGDIEYTGTITDVSDERLKINKEPLLDATSKLMLLNPIKYNQLQLENNKLGNTEYGFTAQDVRKVYPEMVRKVSEKDGVDYLGLSYIQLISPIIKGFQEQQAIIESQATEIKQLKSQIQIILSEIEQIKNN